MLAIRLQRIGRKGDPVYRLIVQDSRRHPQSEKLVERVGTYNPHTKELQIQAEKLQQYLDNGAQPSERVVKILEKSDIKMPKWAIKARTDQKQAIKNPDKLRANQPKETEAEAEAEAEAAEA